MSLPDYAARALEQIMNSGAAGNAESGEQVAYEEDPNLPEESGVESYYAPCEGWETPPPTQPLSRLENLFAFQVDDRRPGSHWADSENQVGTKYVALLDALDGAPTCGVASNNRDDNMSNWRRLSDQVNAWYERGDFAPFLSADADLPIGIEFSPNGKYLAMQDDRHRIGIFATEARPRLVRVIPSRVQASALSIDDSGELLLLQTTETTSVWSAARGAKIDDIREYACAFAYCASLGPFAPEHNAISANFPSNDGWTEFAFPAPEASMSTEGLVAALCARFYTYLPPGADEPFLCRS